MEKAGVVLLKFDTAMPIIVVSKQKMNEAGISLTIVTCAILCEAVGPSWRFSSSSIQVPYIDVKREDNVRIECCYTTHSVYTEICSAVICTTQSEII